MRRVLIKEIERQKELMKLEEQLTLNPLSAIMTLQKYFTGDNDDKSKTKEPIGKKSSFQDMVELVIDKLEGGYYHPNKHKSKGMGNSGETMMGIDRKHGGTINTSPEGVEFWSVIDKSGASKPDSMGGWKWNYMGGNLESKLKKMVGKIIEKRYNEYSNRYLDPETKKIVDENPGLLFHFLYAVWNGPGWFRRFSEKVNDEVKKGETDPKKLYMVALQSRLKSGNSLIAKSGKKIDDIMGTNMV
jgi:hypothetical protein